MPDLIDILNPRNVFQKSKKINNITSLKRIYHRIIKRLIHKRLYFEKNHNLNNTIIVAGGGRSGTTWLAEVLAEYFHYRLIFEPLHPELNYFNPFYNVKYIPPESKNPDFVKRFQNLFSGKLKHQKLDLDNRVFRAGGRVVKFIRANLLLPWINNQFPEIPIVFILRHPCAVVSSRINRGWTIESFNGYLDNNPLKNQYLKQHMDIIENADSAVERQACNWCIENLIPLKAMEDENWIVTTYEDLVFSFEEEIKRIIKYINPTIPIKEDQIVNYRSFQTPNKSKTLDPLELLNIWKSRLSKMQIKNILDIVKQFSLDYVYDDNPFSKTYSRHFS